MDQEFVEEYTQYLKTEQHYQLSLIGNIVKHELDHCFKVL